MIDKIYNELIAFGITEKSDITVALSGGADSVALLLSLYELQKKIGFSLSAAHLNHCLRGDESDGDEQFCKRLCESLAIPLKSSKAEIKERAEQTGESIELAARNIRYQFLSTVSKGFIATAHTANDNLETVIFNLSRGTGLSGLGGIPKQRGNIIRPMLCCTREEIEQYLCNKNATYRTDSSNLETVYTRNFIRKEIVPLLKRINPCVEKTVFETCEGLKLDSDFILLEAQKLLFEAKTECGLNAKFLSCAHKSVASAAIKSFIEQQTGICPDRKTVASAAELINKSGKVNIAGDYFIKSASGKICIYKKSGETEYEMPLDQILSLDEIQNYKFSVVERKVYDNYLKVNKNLVFSGLDYDKINGKAVVRSRKQGDKISIAARGCTKTLKKLFNEQAIPEQNRLSLPIVADEDGVLAVACLAVDKRCRITQETKRVLLIERLG